MLPGHTLSDRGAITEELEALLGVRVALGAADERILATDPAIRG